MNKLDVYGLNGNKCLCVQEIGFTLKAEKKEKKKMKLTNKLYCVCKGMVTYMENGYVDLG